jgi:(2R)-sulfolactate sulfo-lyase subunit beta
MSVSQMVANYDLSKVPSKTVKGRKIEAPAFKTPLAKKAMRAATKDFFQGWRRENGRVGVRNHVLLLPLDDLSNAVCEAVANNVKVSISTCIFAR